MGKRVIVVGGGVAGMRCAITLKKLGCHPMIIEKSAQLGGKLNSFISLSNADIKPEKVIHLIASEILQNDIKTVLCSEVFRINHSDDNLIEVETTDGTLYETDVVVIATGFSWISAGLISEYGYGIYDNVITSSELEDKIMSDNLVLKNNTIPRSVAFIHCVGSRDMRYGVSYCSKMCCSSALKQSVMLKRILGEDSQIYDFFTDMRVWGERGEKLYRDAREIGVEFIRGSVSEIKQSDSKELIIWAEDIILQSNLKLNVDMVVLMNGVKGHDVNRKFAESLNITISEHNFYVNPPMKYDSLFTAYENIYTIGCATAPKSVEESVREGDSVALYISNYFNKRENN